MLPVGFGGVETIVVSGGVVSVAVSGGGVARVADDAEALPATSPGDGLPLPLAWLPPPSTLPSAVMPSSALW